MQDHDKPPPRDPQHYRRQLPHITRPGEAVFVTCRLAGALPAAICEELLRLRQVADAARTVSAAAYYAAHKRCFGHWDAYLDQQAEPLPRWLHQPAIAAAVTRELAAVARAHRLNVVAYCVMPNHVHFIAGLPEDLSTPFYTLMQRFKGRTARVGNQILGRQGQFWQAESYDHVVRDSGEMGRIVTYILHNPVKARLVAEWAHWPYTYLNPSFIGQ